MYFSLPIPLKNFKKKEDSTNNKEHISIINKFYY